MTTKLDDNSERPSQSGGESLDNRTSISFINIGQSLTDDYSSDSPKFSQNITADIKTNTSNNQSSQEDLNSKREEVKPEIRRKSYGNSNSNQNDNEPTQLNDTKNKSNTTDNYLSQFFSVHFVGSLEYGYFESYQNVYIKYSIISGQDWILSSGSDLGITQISRYRLDYDKARAKRRFVFNQPIDISYKSYNFHGWPQIVLSVYCFDSFGNDQIIGYGVCHLPITNQGNRQNFTSQANSSVNATNGNRNTLRKIVYIHAPQSSSFLKLLSSWITGRKPELINPELIARPDCRSVLHMSVVGSVELKIDLMTKDVASNNYTTGK